MDGGNMFMVTPMSQRVALDAGSTYGGYITIANPSNATEDFHYKVVVSSYNVLDEQYTADFLTRSDRSQIVDWITVDNPTGTLKPNETTKVHYKINVPSKKGTIITQTSANFQLIDILITTEKMNIIGTRITIRKHIWYDCCTFVTSVVKRVTSDDVENLSTFAKENFCTL